MTVDFDHGEAGKRMRYLTTKTFDIVDVALASSPKDPVQIDDKLSRRDLLHHSVGFGALAALGAAACGKEKHRALSCNDTSALSSADAQLRTTLAYNDISTEPGKACTQCQQYIPAPSANACGTCKIVKGPINPKGSCKSFVAKPA